MLEKFTDRIYYLAGEQRTDRPYLYYIRGDRCSAVIDAGNSKAHLEKFYGALTAENLPLPAYTLITHWHWDHTFALPFIHGISIASEKTNLQLNKVKDWVWTEEAMSLREKTGEDILFCNTCIREEYADLSAITVSPADLSLEGRMEIDLGGITLQLFTADSPHSHDSLFVYIPEEKLLAVGDALCEDYYDNDGKFDPKKLQTILRWLDAHPAETLLMGHSEPIAKSEMLAYLRGLPEGQI